MKKALLAFLLIGSITSSCKKESGNTSNPLDPINGSWRNTVWGGVANNDIIINISKSSRTAVIQSLGSQTFNFSVGETILSNITATSNAQVFTSDAIFKYGPNNQNTANTTATITLINNNQQIDVVYEPANGITPAEYVYTKVE